LFNCKVCSVEVKTSKEMCKSCSLKLAYSEGRVKDKRGANNPAFGTTITSRLINKYGEVEGVQKLDTWKNKQSIAKTGELNPSYGKLYENGGRSIKGWYKGLFFRSTYELAFVIDFETKHKKLPHSAENKIVIPLNNGRTYTPDYFYENVIYEIKPKRLLITLSVQDKTTAANIFCREHNQVYMVITESDLSSLPVEWKRASWIKALLEENLITLTNYSMSKLGIS